MLLQIAIILVDSKGGNITAKGKRDNIFCSLPQADRQSFPPSFAAPSSSTVMTGEHHYKCRADTTNTFTLSAVDDIHPNPSIVDDRTSCDRRRSVPGQRIYANPAGEFFFSL